MNNDKVQHLRNVPELRFPEFNGVWDEKRIGNILTIKSGKDQKQIENPEGIYPIYGTGGIIGYGEEYLTNKPCVCIGRKGTIDKPIFLDSPFWTVDTLFYSESAENNHPKFQHNLFETINWYKYNEASGVPSLSRKTIESIKVHIPKYNEQEKISESIKLVEYKIILLEQKLENLKLFNKGFINNLIIKNVARKECLADIGYTVNGLTGKSKDDFGTGKPFVTYLNVFNNTFFNPNQCGLVRVEENEKQNELKYGDIIFTTSSETPNEVGMTSVFATKTNESIYLNSFCFIIRLYDFKTIEPHFAAYYFRSKNFRKKMYKLAQGISRYNLSKGNLLKEFVEIPNLEKQKELSVIFGKVDIKVDNLEKKIQALKQFTSSSESFLFYTIFIFQWR
jgi:type I restriction enzyme, S subunit